MDVTGNITAKIWEVWSEFNIFCTLVTMATAAVLIFFVQLPNSCHTPRWIFLQSFMKFDERKESNFFLNPPFKNNNNKKQSKSNMSHKLRLGVIIIIIRNKKSPNLRLGLLLPGMEWTLLRVLKLQCMVGEQQKITRVCTIKMSLFTVTDLIIIIIRRNGTKTNSFGNLIRRNGANTICLSNFVWGT